MKVFRLQKSMYQSWLLENHLETHQHYKCSDHSHQHHLDASPRHGGGSTRIVLVVWNAIGIANGQRPVAPSGEEEPAALGDVASFRDVALGAGSIGKDVAAIQSHAVVSVIGPP